MELSSQDQSLETAIGSLRAAAEAADLARDPDRAVVLFDLALRAKAIRRPEVVEHFDARALRRTRLRVAGGST